VPETTRVPRQHTILRSLGLGLITGAADDDCSAIGTYAQAGAQLGYKALWTAPIMLPMMVVIVYLSGKLGKVTGQGFFRVLRSHAPRWLSLVVLAGVVSGNVIEAGADIGGMAAAIGILIPVPHWAIVFAVTAAVLVLQIWGSYRLIQNVFRVLAMSLLAYVFSAFRSHPDWGQVARGTFIPSIGFDRNTLSILVALIGTTLSAYLYSWQANQEVEEKEAEGKHSLRQRRGASDEELQTSLWDVIAGMFFSNTVMYFIILSAAATLFAAGHHTIASALDAAQALKPVAGRAAGPLFTIGIVGVGFLAVPVMTSGAAYDVSQSFNWISGLHHKPGYARRFYGAIFFFTLVAMALNFIGIQPMRALVLAGIVQGFSTPPLMLLLLIMTNRRSVMGDKVNRPVANILGGITTAVIFAASACLLYSWLHH
jgi:NRAMP (natural resistance-associated macrophage protein)-like metal ion transporter